MNDIASGAFDYNTVLNRTIQTMTNSGLRTIDYGSGWSNRVEVADRRAVMTGFNQLQAKTNEQVAKDLKTDYFEVSWHGGARPEHQAWQGRVYSKKQLVSICGLGSETGLCGANCYHQYNAFIPGVSVRTYTDKQLDQMNAAENQPKEYNGKEYTAYEALQQQRKMETLMRKQRQDIKLLGEGGADEDTILAAKSRYRSSMVQYADFSEKMELPQQKDRVYRDGLTRKTVAKPGGSDIINKSITKEVAGVHTVGKIKKDIYKCITEDIVTDDVVLTDKQLQHIKDKHPDSYRIAIDNLKLTLDDPDFIIADKSHENTGLVIKRLESGDGHTQIVLRVCTSQDKFGYKNSVISSWEISEKRLQNYLRNREILYKKE